MELVATCLFGLEKFVAEDIDALGCRRLETIDGRVLFEGGPEAVARANINLRCAERVLIRLGAFRADSFDALFEGTKALPWESFVGRDGAFPVKGHTVKSRLVSIPDCQRIVKKAVADRLSSVYGLARLPETGVKHQIEFFILNDEASLMIDTSGAPLHKRGYRTESNEAPIRETLAAAMVRMSRPREDVLLADPFCGSGTIAIEAAMLADGVAPGLHRTFAGESFAFLPADVWRDAREEAQSSRRESGMRIYGSDVAPACVELSRANARRAGVASRITFACADARAFASPEPGARGTIVTNPPYGERLGDLASSRKLAEAFGRALRENVPFWQIYIISADEDFARYFGRRPDKVRKLYNGMLRCSYFQFFKKTTIC